MTFDKKFRRFSKKFKNDFSDFMDRSELFARKHGKGVRREFLKLKNEMDEKFDETMKRHDIKGKIKHAMAHLRIMSDVEDKGDYIMVHVELPGVEKKSVVVHMTNDHVDVKAHRRDRVIIRTKHGSRKQLSEKYLHKIIPLPAHIEHEKAKTKFKNGMLRIIIPKKKIERKLRVR